MLADRDNKKVERVTNAFLKMKKFDIGELKKVYNGQIAPHKPDSHEIRRLHSKK